MYLNILSTNQKELLSFLTSFKREFTLVGGTAIALQIGHRMSIDFDLFKEKPLNKVKIKQKIKILDAKKQLLFEDNDGIHFLINDVKITFFQYPFSIKGTINIEKGIKIPDLLTLAAMKFYAMGRRAKWKDYIDIYHLLKDYFTIEQVSTKASELFGDGYSEKLFRQQIVYFENIDYSEPVEWINDPIPDEIIKEGLLNFSLKF
ncbi:MAG: hypothetical protein EAZ20_02530 [Bacteroidetes bacterium]|nr:MAG: hypothetical protein EAZ20_02530 [Bacteroidota bacterium]